MSGDEEDRMQGTMAGWWKQPGPALCRTCEFPHQIEAVVYCSVCDGVVCAVCVVWVVASPDRLCPSCHDSSKGEV
jgi:hypothetical protein